MDLYEKRISNIITVYNKIDLNGVKPNSLYKKNYVSALSGEGVKQLKNQMAQLLQI